MSLINDALRRTQQTMQGGPPPRLADLDLRPLESGPPPVQAGATRARWLIAILVIGLVLGNLVLWLVFGTRSGRSEVSARGADIPPPAASAALPVPEPDAEGGTEGPPGEPVSAVALEPVETADGAPSTPAMPLAVPPAIQRPEFRLQTIVIHPSRPSAMINNQVLFVGDRVEGYTVTAIGQKEVTLRLDGDEVRVGLP